MLVNSQELERPQPALTFFSSGPQPVDPWNLELPLYTYQRCVFHGDSVSPWPAPWKHHMALFNWSPTARQAQSCPQAFLSSVGSLGISTSSLNLSRSRKRQERSGPLWRCHGCVSLPLLLFQGTPRTLPGDFPLSIWSLVLGASHVLGKHSLSWLHSQPFFFFFYYTGSCSGRPWILSSWAYGHVPLCLVTKCLYHSHQPQSISVAGNNEFRLYFIPLSQSPLKWKGVSRGVFCYSLDMTFLQLSCKDLVPNKMCWEVLMHWRDGWGLETPL